jgi:hypothetical protein
VAPESLEIPITPAATATSVLASAEEATEAQLFLGTLANNQFAPEFVEIYKGPPAVAWAL